MVEIIHYLVVPIIIVTKIILILKFEVFKFQDLIFYKNNKNNNNNNNNQRIIRKC